MTSPSHPTTRASGASRRGFVAALAGGAIAQARPTGLLIDTHIHLFEPARFPFHANASYRPESEPLDRYTKFVREAKIDHAVVVHPEPYQDDHRYLEYCFANEPSRGFFKGTCLFDPLDPATPARMKALVDEHPGRIVALRIHEMTAPGKPHETGGSIKNRDLDHPGMKTAWEAATKLGLAIQLHFLPHFAPRIAKLVAQFPDTTVVLDHLARGGLGTPAEYREALRLARFPKVIMKFSGVNYSSKQKAPFADARPMTRAAYDAFGPDRMIWGGLGYSAAQFAEAVEVFETHLGFAPETDRAKVRGLTAKRIYRFD